jgi:DNA modification methylase
VDYTILTGDCRTMLATLPDNSVHCCVTSPPYFGLRDYGHEEQIGLEQSPDAYVAQLVDVFRQVRRVLHPAGTLWLNLGDSYAGSGGAGGDYSVNGLNAGQPKWKSNYKIAPGRTPGIAGHKPKDLLGIPWRVAFALQADGWWLRSEITWCKRAPMPESVRDRPTSATEKIFLLTKKATYFYDAMAVAEPAERGAAGSTFTNGKTGANGMGRVSQLEREETATRNQRNFWLLSPEPYPHVHFATYPTEIPRRAIRAGTSAHGVCTTCGAPWERTVERGEMVQCGHVAPHHNHKRADQPDSTLSQSSALRTGLKASITHAGWQPTCTCGADVVPATVLDPFTGSGTTGAVAISLGRRFVGVELNPAYVELAHRRITAEQPALFGH